MTGQDSASVQFGSVPLRNAGLGGVLALCLIAPLHFFETFPNGWDQAEYAWCVKDGFLPHSAYVLYFFAGRLFALGLPPAIALSTLSMVSGFVALALLHALLHRFRAPASAALAATLLLGISSVFVRQVSTQEVYAFELAWLLACAVVLAGESRFRIELSAVLYGCAVAAHNASGFALPALLVLLLVPGGQGEWGRARAAALWLGIGGLVVGVAYAITAALLPAAPGQRIAETLVYLRGISPGLRLGALLESGFLSDSASALAHRLTSSGVGITRGPMATGPIGLGIVHWVVGAFGLFVLGRQTPRIAFFLGLWLLPYLTYELLLGTSLDYGAYLVFVLPPVCAGCGYAVAEIELRMPAKSPLVLVLGLLGVLVLSATPAMQLAAHWGDTERDRERHESPTTLAAVFAASAVPADAVLIQSRLEPNANLLPFYSERRHISRIGRTLSLFTDRDPYTPMKGTAYEMLTTQRLAALVRAGTPVIAFEENPLRGANVGVLTASRFRWVPAGRADLSAGASALGLADARHREIAGRFLPMFRAELSR